MGVDNPRSPPRRAPRFAEGAAEAVTANERRTAVEAMAFDPDPAKRKLDPMLLATIGLAIIDPAGDRFEGESNELAVVIAQQSADHCFETRVLAQAAIEVWSVASVGSAASRTALLRAAGAFLLHDAATWTAVGAREMPAQAEPDESE
jgi:hypothetical protein